MKKINVILIGAGGRGITYTDIMHNCADKFNVIGVAEPIDSRREHVKKLHNIPDDMCFTDWKPLLQLGKIADLCVVATMDRDHYAPAMAAIELGYDLLLEKPITPEPDECMNVMKAAEANGVKVVVCTVLRYTSLFMTLRELIDSGKIGRVMSINHEECVGNTHQSHSFVRGNWGNVGRSSTMLLQKSCHDMDILQWLVGKKLKKVSSFGTLSYFTKENAPVNAPERCIDGCPETNCPYNAVKLYLSDEAVGWFQTAATREDNPTTEQLENALRNTQYGKCVYKCDNDVVDHQVVSLMFEDDITMTFTMNAFNCGGRFIHIMGTKGEIRAQLAGDKPIEIFDFETREFTEIPMSGLDGISGGHGGGDEGIIYALYDYLTDNYSGKSIPTIRETCYNHMITFAAEKARLTGSVVDFDDFIKEFSK